MGSNKNIKNIAILATRSLIYELTLSPKPGLVDRFDNGSHNDMNFFLLLIVHSLFKIILKII